ncbi:MAG: hypothetical protein EA382_12595 [Spirochaetaceae bacterium]|nr:MAG: hypothetical protein EA382_12595 [Spirochaetaceae bacterium]
MEWNRTEYLDYMTGRSVKRPMLVELFGPLVGLDDEWRAQGASDDEVELRAFGFDYVKRHGVSVAGGLYPKLPDEAVSEDADSIITRDGYGRLVKLAKGKATIPLPLAYPVKGESDWLTFKERYAFSDARFTDGWADAARAARDAGTLITAHIPGGYDEIRQLMGDEEACIGFYTQPELMRDMLDTFARLNREILSRIAAEVPVDQLSVHEDFAGKSGPLLGPNIIDEFIGPYYLSAWEIAEASGAQIFQLDSDGNITPVVDALMRGGVNSILPNEPAAGMDIVELRKKYGSALMLVGGIDKFAVRTSRDAVDAELDYKLQPLMRQGGVIFGLDHRIPDGTPLETYRYYVSRAAAMLGLDPDREPGWARMAF